jgi:hypothetical protein
VVLDGVGQAIPFDEPQGEVELWGDDPVINGIGLKVPTFGGAKGRAIGKDGHEGGRADGWRHRARGDYLSIMG